MTVINKAIDCIKSLLNFLWRVVVVFLAFLIFIAVWLILLYLLGEAGVFQAGYTFIFTDYDYHGLDILGFILSICLGLFLSWVLCKKEIKQTLLFWLKIIICTVLVLLVVFGSAFIKKTIEKNHIEKFIDNSDEILYYGDSNGSSFGIKSTKFKDNVILIDYDTMKIAFLFYSYGDEYVEFQLRKTDNFIDDTNLQIKADLNSPAKQLNTYYLKDNSSHRTTAIQIVMEDGSIYSIKDIVEKDTGYEYFLNLSWSKYYIAKDND